MNDPDFEELLVSPYGDDKSADPGEVPWKLPVAGAILGALVMAVYVLLAVVSGPTEDTSTTSTSVVASQPVQAEGFPPGYAEVTEDVALRADVIQSDQDRTIVYVSSAVRTGVDPETVEPIELATWLMESSESDASLIHQESVIGSLGNVTIEFSQLADPDTAVLYALLPDAVDSTRDTIRLPQEVPTTVTDHRIVVNDSSAVVIDELAIGNGWGSMRWHLEGGLAAKVEAVVTFDGVEFPLSLISPHLAVPRFPLGTPPLAPLWDPAGRERFARIGEPLSESNVPTGITVEFTVSVVTQTGEEIEVPIGMVVRP